MQIISDLHLEHGYTGEWSDLIVPESPVLALLGDIGWPTEDSYQALLEYCSENFDLVIVLTGNHEYYCGSTEDHPATLSMMDTDNLIKKLCSRFDNVVSLMNESIYIGQNSNGTWIVTDRCHGKYLLLGGTLWSDVPDNMVEIARWPVMIIEEFSGSPPKRVVIFIRPQCRGCWTSSELPPSRSLY